MQYRNYGRLDWKASALGFGAMRLPVTNGRPGTGAIDRAQTTELIRRAIDGGVNYVDTAYFYHEGQSESAVGEALKDGYRARVKVATKMPVWITQGPGDFDRILDEQLKRLDMDSVDFYLMHALYKSRWHEFVVKNDLLKQAEKALADGRIKHLGFSIHDDYEGLELILNGSDLWEFCQIQYNYMDTENQVGLRGLKLAASRGLAVNVMEPLMGGRLAEPPADVRAVMNAARAEWSPAAWALGWLWNQPEVSMVLSGMNSIAQVDDNLRTASQVAEGSFTAADEAVIAQAQEIYRARTAVGCTRCGYCMPCPSGVDIPANFHFYNYASLYDDLDGARFRYRIFLPDAQKASHCVECGACAELCPQSLPIPELMPKVAAELGAEMANSPIPITPAPAKS